MAVPSFRVLVVSCALLMALAMLPRVCCSATGEIREVVSVGVGSTERAAVEDAFRNAIEKSIGLFVDSETKLRNDEIIGDNILTSSKGYIEKFKLTSLRHLNGLTEVTIKAEVKLDAVKKAITRLNISTISAESSSNAFARLSTKISRREGADAILKKEFCDFLGVDNVLDMIRIDIDRYEIKEDDLGSGESIPVDVYFSVYFDRSNYETRVAELEEVLKNLGGVSTPLRVSKAEGGDLIVSDPHFQIYSGQVHKSISNTANPENVYFGLVHNNDEGYVLDHFRFPPEWRGIYPFNESSFVTSCADALRQDYLFDILIQFKRGEFVAVEKNPRYMAYCYDECIQAYDRPSVLKVHWSGQKVWGGVRDWVCKRMGEQYGNFANGENHCSSHWRSFESVFFV